MEPPPLPIAMSGSSDGKEELGKSRAMSFSQSSDDSQTAADFIDSQLKLEADAREALPYKFDSCTKELGPLRQLLFACLTCNPPPKTPSDSYTSAAVCYSCSVSCHGEHTLVELFNKRNFVCDCGTTRLPSTSPCTLRINAATNQKGGVFSEPADPNNKYNRNFQNRFCGCDCDYDAEKQKGTMFQCLGLGNVEDGGCGEDWWHAGCVVGLGPNWYENQVSTRKTTGVGSLETITEEAKGDDHVDGPMEDAEEDVPLPPGFPEEEDFEGFICFKCVDANPWIMRYAGSHGFLKPVFKRSLAPSPEVPTEKPIDITECKTAAEIFAGPTPIAEYSQVDITQPTVGTPGSGMEFTPPIYPVEIKTASDTFTAPEPLTRKRKASNSDTDSISSKRIKEDEADIGGKAIGTETTGTLNKLGSSDIAVNSTCKYEQLPPAPSGAVSLFFKADFRDHLCRCSNCFPRMAKHAQLLEQEEVYEPPVSNDGEGSTVGSGSLLDRGERALTNVDRVRAIEGAMAYNHLKEKLKPFFKEFAESGKAISAEDIKAHFAKMRGDEEAIEQAGEVAASNGDNRREQSGY